MNPFKSSSTPRSQVLRQKRAQKTADNIESARQNIHNTPKEAADPHAFRPVMPPASTFQTFPKVNQPASHTYSRAGCTTCPRLPAGSVLR